MILPRQDDTDPRSQMQRLRAATGECLVVDSVTYLDSTARARVVVCGSHGGVYAAAVAAQHGVRGIVLNDAGVGRDEAGIAGLWLLDDVGIPCVVAGHLSANIGDGADCLERGMISYINNSAGLLGCYVGMSVSHAVTRLADARPLGQSAPPIDEARHLVLDGVPRVWALDSASLVRLDDVGDLVMTGSHGRLIGHRTSSALKFDVVGAVFNDAGNPGACRAGRLEALDLRGVVAATVDVNSARIGDGRSTFYDGIISAVNALAESLGASIGISARQFADLVRSAQRIRGS